MYPSDIIIFPLSGVLSGYTIHPAHVANTLLHLSGVESTIGLNPLNGFPSLTQRISGIENFSAFVVTTPLGFGGFGGNILSGQFSNTLNDGFLHQADWNTFNNKISTAANIGSGSGLYSGLAGTSLNFKSLIAGSNVSFAITGGDITINAAVPGGTGIGGPGTTTNHAVMSWAGVIGAAANNSSILISTDGLTLSGPNLSGNSISGINGNITTFSNNTLNGNQGYFNNLSGTIISGNNFSVAGGSITTTSTTGNIGTTLAPFNQINTNNLVLVGNLSGTTSGTQSIGSSSKTFGTVFTDNISGVAARGLTKAWVTINGTNGAILDSYNIASVARVDRGVYNITFSKPFANGNYAVVAMSEYGAADQNWGFASVAGKTTTVCGIWNISYLGLQQDCKTLSASFLSSL